jgi:hypothetical protein
MKKYIIGFIAIVLAFALSAFTKPPKKQSGTKLFLFNIATAGSYGPSQVADVANWDLYEDINPCEEIAAEVPCSIEVPDDAVYVNGTHPSSCVVIDVSSSGVIRIVIDVKSCATLISFLLPIINKMRQ